MRTTWPLPTSSGRSHSSWCKRADRSITPRTRAERRTSGSPSEPFPAGWDERHRPSRISASPKPRGDNSAEQQHGRAQRHLADAGRPHRFDGALGREARPARPPRRYPGTPQCRTDEQDRMHRLIRRPQGLEPSGAAVMRALKRLQQWLTTPKSARPMRGAARHRPPPAKRGRPRSAKPGRPMTAPPGGSCSHPAC